MDAGTGTYVDPVYEYIDVTWLINSPEFARKDALSVDVDHRVGTSFTDVRVHRHRLDGKTFRNWWVGFGRFGDPVAKSRF